MTNEVFDNQYHHDVSSLIKDLEGPDYITGVFSDIGVKSLIILSTVFRVDQSYLGSYFARVLSTNKTLLQGRKVLDLGCGCGLLGLVCALHGAKRVHFSDINPAAIKNSRLNYLLLDVANVTFSIGDMFDNIPRRRRFNLIVFNPPSITGTPANYPETAFIREDRVILDFYRDFPKYLKRNGAVVMPGSSRFDGYLSPINMVRRYNLPHQIIDEQSEADGNSKYVICFQRGK